MKPKNKFQKRIVEASKKLPKITNAQIKWAYKNCIEHIGHKSKKSIVTCLECGHKWKDKTNKEHCSCPHCNTHLKIEETRKRTFMDYEYMCIVTACEGFQVLRFIYVECNMKVGKEADYYYTEAVQWWIAPNGKTATMARLKQMGFYSFRWNLYSDLEIRPEKPLYNVTPTAVYPRQKLIPEIVRSGYNKEFYKLTPFDLLHFLLSNSRAETLLKARQISLVQYFAYHTSKNIQDYWPSIKICMRNKFCIEDVQMWCDYIDLLRFFEKDLHSTKYVCPIDLHTEHDRYVRKRREYQKRVDEEEARRKALEDEAFFKETKSRFFGVEFSDGLLTIRVLESVQEIMQEGDAMKHCLFTNNYHLKTDSLILSACIDNKRIETIELSISELKILQSQGVSNKITEYHNQILKLVEQNIPLIEKRLAA
ncbi:PcfJ domain-containing protein [Dysgonomonas termitidis]|uniref:PcfJ domain-containing protein n=1 Tax=Dysgonomonas termitidis TaxID=1516126 RepID=A0ABV9KZ50_9BACT